MTVKELLTPYVKFHIYREIKSSSIIYEHNIMVSMNLLVCDCLNMRIELCHMISLCKNKKLLQILLDYNAYIETRSFTFGVCSTNQKHIILYKRCIKHSKILQEYFKITI